jgi:hypothetical protein
LADESKIIFDEFHLAAKHNIFCGNFRPLKLLGKAQWVATEITLATEINIGLVSAAR